MHVVPPCRRTASWPRSDSPAGTRRARTTTVVSPPPPSPPPPSPPSPPPPSPPSPPDDYATVQRAGREFAREYFGRLNMTGRAGSVADMFAERVRFYAMDVHESRPAVGRAHAVEALRRFCRAYGGRGGGEAHRCVTILSVDARKDDDGDDRCRDCGVTVGGGGAAGGDDGRGFDRYELFVFAEWTTPAAAVDACPRRPPVPPTPFVQTFSVRRHRARDHGPAAADPPAQPCPLEILSTTVKMTSAAADAPSPSAHDFVHSEDTQNNIYSSSKIQSSNKIISSHKKQLNVVDNNISTLSSRPFVSTMSLKPSVTALSSKQSATSTRFSYGGEKPPGTRWSFGINGTDSKSRKRFSQYKEFEVYQKRVETFLNGTGDGDENNALTARLCVDGLDTKITADDLYDAFGQFGTVLWVRIVTTNEDSGIQTALAGYRRPNSHTRYVGHVCFKQIEALTRAMDKQCQVGGCFVRGICMPIRRFIEFDQ